jgi:hypothetical protein
MSISHLSAAGFGPYFCYQQGNLKKRPSMEAIKRYLNIGSTPERVFQGIYDIDDYQ